MDLSLAIALGIALIIAILLIVFNDTPNEKVTYRKYIASIFFEKDYFASEKELQQRISMLKLDKYATKIIEKTLPRLKIDLIAENESSKKIYSKISQYPDTPNGEQLSEQSFLLQLNCKELPHNNLLPKNGMLYFFLDKNIMKTEHKNFVTVKYIEFPNQLQPCQSVDNYCCKDNWKIVFNKTLSLPDFESDWTFDTFQDYERDGYFKLINQESENQLFGYPSSLTHCFDFNATEKTLLLQLDCDKWANEITQWGRIFVFIDNENLLKKDFSKIYSHFQYAEKN